MPTAATSHGSQRGRGKRARKCHARASPGVSAMSRRAGGSTHGSSQRVQPPATIKPPMVNTANCCKPSTPEAKNAKYAIATDTIAVASRGHNARMLSPAGTPTRRWLNTRSGYS